ncbi:MAG: N-carbamoylputrescine amidase [Alphaproteobacteria bacterium]|nr:N-carbamoylputrescine amidase [Alphaproteobacteria bacterium]
MSKVTVAATQMACSWDIEANLDRAEELVREAAVQGANVVLLQELFATPYFCPDQKQEHFTLAQPAEGNRTIARFAALAAELGVVLPVSFFERANNAYFNSVAMVDADGTVLGLYRKSHIPQGPGYEEKFYFNPGDTGFHAWETRYGTIGVGICWDQWFPECARAMALQGADILLYPTAIGSEPNNPAIDSRDHWQRVMQGHAAANMVVLAASNRVGVEESDSATMTFYGSSFVAGPTGEMVAEANRADQAVVMASFNLDEVRARRASWGLFRDRRPDLYDTLLTLDGDDF